MCEIGDGQAIERVNADVVNYEDESIKERWKNVVGCNSIL